MMMFPYVHHVHTHYMYLAYMMSPYNMIQMRMPFILIQVPHIRELHLLKERLRLLTLVQGINLKS